METDSAKSEISDISATPTMKSMMTTVSAMTDMVTELRNVAKTSEEDRKVSVTVRFWLDLGCVVNPFPPGSLLLVPVNQCI